MGKIIQRNPALVHFKKQLSFFYLGDLMSKPAKKLCVGGVQVAVWQNTGKNNDFYTVTITRRFKDNSDEWQSSNSLKVNDIPKAILALQEAYRELALKELLPENPPAKKAKTQE